MKVTYSRSTHASANAATKDQPLTTQRVWAIGGGKGGIGKTLLSSNLCVYLSWLHREVVAIDLDLGGSNLHTALGLDPPSSTLNDFLQGRVPELKSLYQKTNITNLQLISGAQDPIGFSNIKKTNKTKLVQNFRDLAADFVLLDLGAGTDPHTLDFFLEADKKIIVVTPEPTSIENAYRFIKASFFRMLRTCVTSTETRELIEAAIEQKNTRGITSPRDLVKEIQKISPAESLQFEKKLEDFRLAIIVNQVRTRSETDIGRSIDLVCSRYFGVRVDYVGYLPYDNAVWQSVRRKVPFLIDNPTSQAVVHLEQIVRNLLRL